MTVLWRDIEGYEGLYKVSNEGDVMRLYKNGLRMNKYSYSRILKPFWRGRYLCVELSKGDEQRMFPVSRLVAKAFIPNPERKPEDEGNPGVSFSFIDMTSPHYLYFFPPHPITEQAFSQAQVKKLLKTQPKKKAESTITFWYGGWSLRELKAMRHDMFYDQSWYNSHAFFDAKHPKGMYTVCLKVPDSNKKNYDEQVALVGKDGLCPVAIAATAYLLTMIESGSDPLDGDWTRCSDGAVADFRATLHVSEGRVNVDNYWDDRRNGGLWASSVRTSES